MVRFMDQTIDTPTALATSSPTQNFRENFEVDDMAYHEIEEVGDTTDDDESETGRILGEEQ